MGLELIHAMLCSFINHNDRTILHGWVPGFLLIEPFLYTMLKLLQIDKGIKVASHEIPSFMFIQTQVMSWSP
jgi:hypothetical protein